MRRQRIVLAEDHDAVAEQLRSVLADHYDVEVVGDGDALLQAVERERPDAVVTDIAMPRRNGLLAARAVLNRYPELAVVFVSISDAPEMIRHAQSQGVLGYVLKCDAGEELLQAVQSALRGTLYISLHARMALGAL
ncbi:MAG TPA: response regulator transcription factor [Povalibacter sp.]|uniref:response regulator n=1 Tax=Povalibacter sp. TaxID=1962978 RepID=UPI002C3DE248|nr:response regulator transcription factor [Povalibacter sp.]HMN45867.1 response regulator transcription factor [Povalibacter sp.]